jgi:Protein phosphatase 2C
VSANQDTRQTCAVPQATLASFPRPGKLDNEDLVGMMGSAAWLLDGTSPRDSARCCDRDGSWYVHQLAAELVRVLANDARSDLQDVLAAAIKAVADEHNATCRPGPAGGPSATVLLVRQRSSVLDYLILGDSALLTQTPEGVTHHSDKRLAKVATELRGQIRGHLQAGQGYQAPTYQRLLRELVTAERTVRNTEHGYWIAGYEPRAAYHSLTGTCRIGVGAKAVQRVALVSDGLERAVTVFGLYRSWDELLDRLVTTGPAACIQELRQAEAADPDGHMNPRTAASDDASGVLLQFV